MIYVPGEGPQDAKLMIVGEFPTEQDTLAERPFVGPAGQLLDGMLKDAGIDRHQCYLTYLLKYRPPANNFAKATDLGIDINKQVENLFKEINEIKPNAILALGEKALYYLTGYKGIKSYRGSILRGKIPNVKIIATYPPSAFLRDGEKGAMTYAARSYVLLDFARAWDEAKNSKWDLPVRRLEIARNSSDVQKFFAQYNGQKIAANDIESVKCVPSCMSFAFNRHHAMSIPLLPGLINTSSSLSDTAESWRYIQNKYLELGIVGQNFKYDEHKLTNPCGFGGIRLHADTAMMAHVLYPEFPKALEFLTSVFTREPYYKSEYKDWVPGKDSYEQVLSYNAKDSAITFEVYEELEKELKEEGLWEFYFYFFNHAHRLYTDIENCGVAVDFKVRAELITKYTEKAKKLQEFIDEVVGKKVNVNSPQQMNKLLYQFLELPRRKDSSEDTIIALMQNAIKADKHLWKKSLLKAILDLRKTKKTIGNYLKARTDFDGRMRTQYNINGTENGRTSTSKVDSRKRINRPVFTGLAFQTITKHGQVGTDLRKMLVPDPGCCFLQMDFSQAEARIVGVLSEDWDLLRKFDSGIDVHSELAYKINSRTWNGQRAKDDERFIGKTGRHAYNYSVGPKTFMLQVNTDAEKFGIDLNISQWKAGKILESVKEAHPNVEKVFHAQIGDILASTRTLYNPFGRRRIFYNRFDDSLIREGLAFIPQSTVRDQMLKLMIEFVREFPMLAKSICMEAHDAILLNCPLNMVDDVAAWLKNWAETNLIDFSTCVLPRNYKLKIPCDIEIGEVNYKDLVKYKRVA